MEQQKILNLLDEANDSKYVTREWNIANGKHGIWNIIIWKIWWKK